MASKKNKIDRMTAMIFKSKSIVSSFLPPSGGGLGVSPLQLGITGQRQVVEQVSALLLGFRVGKNMLQYWQKEWSTIEESIRVGLIFENQSNSKWFHRSSWGPSGGRLRGWGFECVRNRQNLPVKSFGCRGFGVTGAIMRDFPYRRDNSQNLNDQGFAVGTSKPRLVPPLRLFFWPTVNREMQMTVGTATMNLIVNNVAHGTSVSVPPARRLLTGRPRRDGLGFIGQSFSQMSVPVRKSYRIAVDDFGVLELFSCQQSGQLDQDKLKLRSFFGHCTHRFLLSGQHADQFEVGQRYKTPFASIVRVVDINIPVWSPLGRGLVGPPLYSGTHTVKETTVVSLIDQFHQICRSLIVELSHRSPSSGARPGLVYKPFWVTLLDGFEKLTPTRNQRVVLFLSELVSLELVLQPGLFENPIFPFVKPDLESVPPNMIFQVNNIVLGHRSSGGGQPIPFETGKAAGLVVVENRRQAVFSDNRFGTVVTSPGSYKLFALIVFKNFTDRPVRILGTNSQRLALTSRTNQIRSSCHPFTSLRQHADQLDLNSTPKRIRSFRIQNVGDCPNAPLGRRPIPTWRLTGGNGEPEPGEWPRIETPAGGPIGQLDKIHHSLLCQYADYLKLPVGPIAVARHSSIKVEQPSPILAILTYDHGIHRGAKLCFESFAEFHEIHRFTSLNKAPHQRGAARAAGDTPTGSQFLFLGLSGACRLPGLVSLGGLPLLHLLYRTPNIGNSKRVVKENLNFLSIQPNDLADRQIKELLKCA